MADSFQRVTTQSWRSRMRGAFAGVFFGIVLIAGGSGLLFWNEGRAVKRHKTLQEGAGEVTTVASGTIDLEHEGSLIHTTGLASSSQVLRDDRFGVESPALKLVRRVEMYQWNESSRSEERTKLGGGTETVTTYTYDKEWSSRPIDSASFQESFGHDNPDFPIRSEQWVALPIQVGAFVLSEPLARQLSRDDPLALDAASARRVSSVLGRQASLDSAGGVFVGRSQGSPEVGDLRIRYRVTEPAVVSVVGSQLGNEVTTHQTRVGGTIALLDYGEVPADQMFESAQSANRFLTWLLRVVGFLVLVMAFGMVFRPLPVLADVLPIAGRIVRMGVGFVCFALAAVLALLVIAVGWVFYRPVLGIGLFVLAGVFVFLLLRRNRKVTADLPPLPVPPPVPGD